MKDKDVVSRAKEIFSRGLPRSITSRVYTLAGLCPFLQHIWRWHLRKVFNICIQMSATSTSPSPDCRRHPAPVDLLIIRPRSWKLSSTANSCLSFCACCTMGRQRQVFDKDINDESRCCLERKCSHVMCPALEVIVAPAGQGGLLLTGSRNGTSWECR